VAWSLVLREIFNCVELTKVAVWATPLKVTVELETKPVPVIVSVCAVAPAITGVGDRPVIVGTALITVKLSVLDTPPPGDGFVTTTA
jgi:hypothetical protein